MAEQLWEIQRPTGWTDEQTCAIPYARLREISEAESKRAYRQERQQLEAAAYTAFLLGAGKGLTWGAFLQKHGLGEKSVEVVPVAQDDVERLKAEAERIADKAIAGYLAAKKQQKARLEMREYVETKKRKGNEPEELRERLRAIRESIGEQKSGSQ